MLPGTICTVQFNSFLYIQLFIYLLLWPFIYFYFVYVCLYTMHILFKSLGGWETAFRLPVCTKLRDIDNKVDFKIEKIRITQQSPDFFIKDFFQE